MKWRKSWTSIENEEMERTLPVILYWLAYFQSTCVVTCHTDRFMKKTRFRMTYGLMINPAYTVCTRSSDPFYIVKVSIKMGNYFFDIQYNSTYMHIFTLYEYMLLLVHSISADH